MIVVEIISRIRRLQKLFKNDNESADHFLTEHLDLFDNLSIVQCQFILTTIDTELEISKSFGLELTDKERNREKMAFLTVFNSRINIIRELAQLRGVDGDAAYSKTFSILLEELYDFLGDIGKKYYEASSQQRSPEVRNKYNTHLNSTLARIYRGFWDDKFVP